MSIMWAAIAFALSACGIDVTSSERTVLNETSATTPIGIADPFERFNNLLPIVVQRPNLAGDDYIVGTETGPVVERSPQIRAVLTKDQLRSTPRMPMDRRQNERDVSSIEASSISVPDQQVVDDHVNDPRAGAADVLRGDKHWDWVASVKPGLPIRHQADAGNDDSRLPSLSVFIQRDRVGLTPQLESRGRGAQALAGSPGGIGRKEQADDQAEDSGGGQDGLQIRITRSLECRVGGLPLGTKVALTIVLTLVTGALVIIGITRGLKSITRPGETIFLLRFLAMVAWTQGCLHGAFWPFALGTWYLWQACPGG